MGGGALARMWGWVMPNWEEKKSCTASASHSCLQAATSAVEVHDSYCGSDLTGVEECFIY